jgi:hypothetical protein
VDGQGYSKGMWRCRPISRRALSRCAKLFISFNFTKPFYFLLFTKIHSNVNLMGILHNSYSRWCIVRMVCEDRQILFWPGQRDESEATDCYFYLTVELSLLT